VNGREPAERDVKLLGGEEVAVSCGDVMKLRAKLGIRNCIEERHDSPDIFPLRYLVGHRARSLQPEQHRLSIIRDRDTSGTYIAMRGADCVQGRERPCESAPEAKHAVARHRPRSVLERFPTGERRDDVATALVFADPVHRAQTGMSDPREDLRAGEA
jgi:hypothetical protein